MSKWNRPMRSYDPGRIICPACGKPVTAAVFVDGAYRHPYDCTLPKGRPSPETRERLRKAAGL